ncbi:MAG: hypothetical protein ACFE0P_12180 [Oceanicaulis sp.]
MARDGASPNGAETAAGLALRALSATAEARAGADHPGLFASDDNPWTDRIARELREAVAGVLGPAHGGCHAVAARWRFPSLIKDGPVLATSDPLYDIAWRVYAADGSAMLAQPLIAECAWRGGWRSLSAAADRLAQGRAHVKLLCAMDDPDRDIGGMTLVQACAFRISAFAPPGEDVMLAFYGRAGSWRETAGFAVHTHVTGEDQVFAVNPHG